MKPASAFRLTVATTAMLVAHAASGLLLGGPAMAAPPAAAAATGAPAVVLSGQAGAWGPPAMAAGQLSDSGVLLLIDGQEFGWRLKVRTSKKTLRVVEQLTLPSEPKTWGDPEPGLKRRTSADGRTATTELDLTPVDGVIESRWIVTSGDPRGTWILKVQVEDQPAQVFRLQAR